MSFDQRRIAQYVVTPSLYIEKISSSMAIICICTMECISFLLWIDYSNKYAIILIHYVSIMYELNMCVYFFNY